MVPLPLLILMSVICQADFNDDGTVSNLDVGVLVSQFGTGVPDADLNQDGVVNNLDTGPFVEAFGKGCVRTASLSWTAPTQNEDGTALEDLAGYNVYGGTDGETFTKQNTALIPATNTTYETGELTFTVWYFVATAVDESGNESVYSNMASKDMNPEQ